MTLIEKIARAIAATDSAEKYWESYTKQATAALAIADPVIRKDALEDAWRNINSMIVQGPLPGNGCDKSAERNGLVLASNVVAELRDNFSEAA